MESPAMMRTGSSPGTATRLMARGLEQINRLLAADRRELDRLVEETGQLLVRAVLLTVAVRHEGGLPITAQRLEELVAALRDSVEDGRSAARAWNARR